MQKSQLSQRLRQLDRGSFWMWTIPIVVGHVFLAYVTTHGGSQLATVDTLLIILIALVLAGRFRDIGWPIWIGPSFVLVTMLVLPFVALGYAILSHPHPQTPEFLQWLNGIGLIVGPLNLLLLIVAGSVPGRPVAPASSLDRDMMRHVSGEWAAREATRAGERLRVPPRPSVPAEPDPIKATTWRVIKPVVIVIGILVAAKVLLQVADGVVRDLNHGAGFLPDFLVGSRSSGPPLDHPYLPASPIPQYASPPSAAEEKPSLSQGTRPLTPPQVRYCLAQGIRIQGAAKAVNTTSTVEASRFLALSDDYNPRCGNYHYTPGSLDSVKEEVEAQRAALELQGVVLVRPSDVEEKPPVAQGALLPEAQARYCLAQGIRMQGAAKVVNTASTAEASRLLALSDDYNPRCGNYKLAPGVSSSIKAQVEARRAALEREGAALIRPPAVPR